MDSRGIDGEATQRGEPTSAATVKAVEMCSHPDDLQQNAGGSTQAKRPTIVIMWLYKKQAYLRPAILVSAAQQHFSVQYSCARTHAHTHARVQNGDM